jgi:GMP synthase PP-ATPase subunit
MLNAPYSGFDPALTIVLAEAFDRAWNTAENSGVTTVVKGGAEAMRRSIALRIVTLADQGLTNVTELAMDALSYVTEKQFPEAQEGLAKRM